MSVYTEEVSVTVLVFLRCLFSPLKDRYYAFSPTGALPWTPLGGFRLPYPLSKFLATPVLVAPQPACQTADIWESTMQGGTTERDVTNHTYAFCSPTQRRIL